MKNQEELNALTVPELQDKLRHYKEELFQLRFQAATGQLSNPSRIEIVRRNIARVNTRLSQLQKESLRARLKEELESLYKEKKISDPRQIPLREKIAMLRTKLSQKASKVRQEIRTEVDKKATELVKALRTRITEKIKTVKGREESQLRAASLRLRDPKFTARKKFLDKLNSMGFNEASQFVSLKETKRAKLGELEQIRAMQRELISGRLPF
ncbi:MAG: LSU ribosomal protein L29p (L35e) [Candidatus Ozemobacter sibiricus]|jgi:large subunit ribosomal protein L29|uniref:Large ribosomal subunit protein uL29 n=1 Tax=Candidatus Ozemobacter sibiricus TaxID=2268124 RepID=A0A367ZK61_9BACT|nr:MAG: LSU ribosomal protein L29p (L35e) [Candidatus Ozemobacter sibiricus]